jgi:Tfp pilus assembly protein PilF
VQIDRTGSSDALVARGHEALERRELATARAYFEAALEKERQNTHAMAGLAEVALAQRDAATAVAWAERAVALRRRRAPYRIILGDARALAGDLEGARQAWREALQIDRGSRDARRRLQE